MQQLIALLIILIVVPISGLAISADAQSLPNTIPTFTSKILGISFAYTPSPDTKDLEEWVSAENFTAEKRDGIEWWLADLDTTIYPDVNFQIRADSPKTAAYDYEKWGGQIPFRYGGESLDDLCQKKSFLHAENRLVTLQYCELRKNAQGVSYVRFGINATAHMKDEKISGSPIAQPNPPSVDPLNPGETYEGIFFQTRSPEWPGMTIYVRSGGPENDKEKKDRMEYEKIIRNVCEKNRIAWACEEKNRKENGDIIAEYKEGLAHIETAASTLRYTTKPLSHPTYKERMKACEAIPNGSVTKVQETQRIFINLPEDFYPGISQSYKFQTIRGDADAGWISNGGLCNDSPGCWTCYYEFSGNGVTQFFVKSTIKGVPDYKVLFRVKDLPDN